MVIVLDSHGHKARRKDREVKRTDRVIATIDSDGMFVPLDTPIAGSEFIASLPATTTPNSSRVGGMGRG